MAARRRGGAARIAQNVRPGMLGGQGDLRGGSTHRATGRLWAGFPSELGSGRGETSQTPGLPQSLGRVVPLCVRPLCVYSPGAGWSAPDYRSAESERFLVGLFCAHGQGMKCW